MGHKKKNSDSRDLHQQAYDRLKSMQHFGDSKAADKRYDREHDTNIVSKKIYSYETYRTYWKHIKYFLGWLKERKPGLKKLERARPFVSEWLQSRVDAGLSAWTIQTEEAALTKLFGINKDDPDRFQPPKRKKDEIKRSRGPKIRDKHFSEVNNSELISFCKGGGFRRNILERLRGRDLYTREMIESRLVKARNENDMEMIKICTDALDTFPSKEYFILHYQDKGGKTRISPIMGPHMNDIIDRMRSTRPEMLVWEHVSENCDVHSYRSDYAQYIYKEYARPASELKYENKILCADGKYRSEVYITRGKEKKKIDRKAIGIISIALGHNREDTAIANYVRNL